MDSGSQMRKKSKSIASQPCMWVMIQKDIKLDAPSNTHFQQRKRKQRKVKWKLESLTMMQIKLSQQQNYLCDEVNEINELTLEKELLRRKAMLYK